MAQLAIRAIIQEMKLSSIFKACDVRGIYGQDLTEPAVLRIGRAVGTLVPGKAVVVGGDVRLSTPLLKSSLIKGLVRSKAHVIDIGIVPTPAFYYAKHHLGADAGIMVTASHNPPEFNGLKITIGQFPITIDELESIRMLAEQGTFTDGPGSVRDQDITSSYRSHILSIAPKVEKGQNPLRLVVDCGHGCYSDIAPGLLAGLGYGVEQLYCVADGSFPMRSPNSAIPGNLSALSRMVTDLGADLGIAFDGDGDRVSFIDDRGRFLPSDKAIVILAKHILALDPGAKVVYDLKCSSAVHESISAAGGQPIPERSGHTFIKARMINEKAVFGGELSGHYFFRELHGGDDGLYCASVVAGIITKAGTALSDLADAVPEYATTPDIRLRFDGDRRAVMDRLAKGFPAQDTSRLDGVKVQFPEGWGLARVSVTEPVITLRFEAATPSALARIIDRFLEPVDELRPAVMHFLQAHAGEEIG